MTWSENFGIRPMPRAYYILKAADAKVAHVEVTNWLEDATRDLQSNGATYGRELRIMALAQERKRLVTIYTECKRYAG